ncbi:MAPK/MAK/MRK overlapping kinase-like isoform X2 [Cimex lectularius]|uniref:Protein kinase domain-containing protein n=1 Tax=Cimex lectularius TaxID=79782 RepID=A0A8I6TI26_CIMLE|nr:MAPK/MAK/MRK overlapping kinase-like isoform X2 [Cimex lectularius]
MEFEEHHCEQDEEKYHMEMELENRFGSFIHEYKVECKIGEGSFSEVLKCKDKHSGLMIAAKQLKKSFRSATHASELPELIAMRKLTKHSNILHMLESHFDPLTGKVTLVFELMDMSLYDMMKTRKSVPEVRAKNYLYQIVKGVDHIHHHGIFHRDIKPENILVKGDLLKISDLGSIKGIYARHPYTEYISTRWYRSPECLLTTGFYGPKMDVWAIGCVFFELLTLKPLFPGSSELDQIAKINHVLGTPSPRLLAKFRKHKCRNSSVCFPAKQGTGLHQLMPFISETGRDIFKHMIVYDPDVRINVRRLMDHKYFAEFRDNEMFQAPSVSQSQQPENGAKANWRNPALLSYLTLEKRRRPKIRNKRINAKHSEVAEKASTTRVAIHKRVAAQKPISDYLPVPQQKANSIAVPQAQVSIPAPSPQPVPQPMVQESPQTQITQLVPRPNQLMIAPQPQKRLLPNTLQTNQPQITLQKTIKRANASVSSLTAKKGMVGTVKLSLPTNKVPQPAIMNPALEKLKARLNAKGTSGKSFRPPVNKLGLVNKNPHLYADPNPAR